MTNTASVSIIKAFSLEGGSLSHCRNLCNKSSVSTVLREVHLIHSTNTKVYLGPFASLGVKADVCHVYWPDKRSVVADEGKNSPLWERQVQADEQQREEGGGRKENKKQKTDPENNEDKTEQE